ncbi:mitochondrial zinc maintenance protein 1, mitochondrial [Usnea florida]
MALAAYRHILRSTRVAFQGDLRILSAARVEARSKFDQHRLLSPSSTEAEQKVLEAREVARILRQNVVQGEQITGPKDKGQRYQLRIHEEIERGNNDSIKKGSNLASTATGFCGGV